MMEILLLIALYGTYRIIREIVLQRKCPDDRELRNVVLGITKKNTEIADRVIMHLGICEKCQEKARDMGSE
jgi:hypothetical protein